MIWRIYFAASAVATVLYMAAGYRVAKRKAQQCKK